jgi:transcriptional regulator
MYDIPHFKANENTDVLNFMHQHPFVLICGVDENLKPVATHVPILIEEREDKLFISGHFMRKQDHTIAFEKNNQVLVIFTGSNSYVSATNYEQQNTASTWNYKAVHASGKLKFLNDEKLLELLQNLTKKFEKNSHSPALVEKMDSNYLKQHMKAIVAFEIEVEEINHVFKMSQNKEQNTREKIIASLEKDGNYNSIELAMEMKKFYNKPSF